MTGSPAGRTSAFVDELVAKLVVRYGVLNYANVFRVVNLSGLAQGLANLSAAQRLREGGATAI